MDLNPDSGQDLPGWPSEAWIDPAEEHARFRLRLQKMRLGFSLLGLALVVASLSAVGDLFMVFAGFRQPVGVMLGIPHFELIEGGIITWVSLFGVCLIWGPWPDIHWQRRSGILLMMCLIDALLWTIDHAAEVGLYDGAIGHDWFREALGSALGWSEFALIASLTSDMAVHLGEPRANELSKSVRSLATTGAMMWFLYFTMRTDWTPPIWPLRARMFNLISFMMYLSWHVIWTICLVQTAGLSVMASRCCMKTLLDLKATDEAQDLLPSRSEDGWDEMMRNSGPNGGA